ncbi:MCE family protein [Mycolicibacter kumamotonensis]|uniref:MCE family protein n=1 Tax=Mycolicibacter kumamotonensis TaxID=354243 RepID=A0A7K3LBF3_9MYCO|nr:MCE family protein [Mycolicibacter kumamotonensis]NDJ89697.1 MCE family protein [Mycolicibacter kumamotonensis]
MSVAIRNIVRCTAASVLLALATIALGGCQWRGLNSLPLPGTQGRGSGSFVVQAQLPDVGYIEPNSRVRVADANVGTVTKIERQGWHALVTMRLNRDVDLPANAIAKVGQTSLLGSLHIELAPPVEAPAQGKLQDGSLISLDRGGLYPNTDQTLAALSLLLNGGGIGQIQDITAAFASAFAGRDKDLRGLIEHFDQFVTRLNGQTGDIIAATDSFNNLVGQFADQKPMLDKAMRTIPNALSVLAADRKELTEAFDTFGKFSALATDAVNRTKEDLVEEFKAVGPVLESLANSGLALTRSLGELATVPFPKETLRNWVRGDYGNLTAIFDLTLSRLDNGLLTGTRWEGDLTELEMQWGRTIGQIPSPYTASNPLVIPYRLDQDW